LVLEEKGKGTSRKDVIETVQLTESTESPDRVASFVNDVWTGQIKPKDEPAPVVTPATGTTTAPCPFQSWTARFASSTRTGPSAR